MVKIPVSFRSVYAGLEKQSHTELYESNGKAHSPTNDLSVLVNSFIEGDNGDVKKHGEENDSTKSRRKFNDSELCNCETVESLRNLLKMDEIDVKRSIRDKVEFVSRMIDGGSPKKFKRRLMTRLREMGFDAGLCKSWWDKTTQVRFGSYEYIDVNVSGKVDELNQVVKLMSAAIQVSMKCEELHIPPWRRNTYMQAKWFSPYRRTCNQNIKALRSTNDSPIKRYIGFETFPVNRRPLGIIHDCKDGLSSKIESLRVGNLAKVLDGNGRL